MCSARVVLVCVLVCGFVCSCVCSCVCLCVCSLVCQALLLRLFEASRAGISLRRARDVLLGAQGEAEGRHHRLLGWNSRIFFARGIKGKERRWGFSSRKGVRGCSTSRRNASSMAAGLRGLLLSGCPGKLDSTPISSPATPMRNQLLLKESGLTMMGGTPAVTCQLLASELQPVS